MRYKQSAYKWLVANLINVPSFSFFPQRKTNSLIFADPKSDAACQHAAKKPASIPDDFATLCFPNWDALDVTAEFSWLQVSALFDLI